MGRVNIHLPEELHTKVKKAEINVSAVCQEALEKELRIKEGLKMDNEKLIKLKTKILREKDAANQECFEIGRNIAKEWGTECRLDYGDLIGANRNIINQELAEAIDDHIRQFIDEDSATLSREKLDEGFISGLQEIAKEIGVEE